MQYEILICKYCMSKHILCLFLMFHIVCQGHENLQEKELSQGHIKGNKSRELQA